MARNNNLFDIVLSIIFPEAKIAITALNKLGLTRGMVRKLEKSIPGIRKALPALKGSQEQIKKAQQQLAKALKTTEARAYGSFLNNPALLSEALGKMTPQERKEFGESIAEATGGVEEASLSSSWIISGIYEETGLGVGTLTITTKQGKSYDYPNVSVVVWESMKVAKGSHGGGAGSVFWAMYLRKYNRTRTRARTSIAFKLALG